MSVVTNTILATGVDELTRAVFRTDKNAKSSTRLDEINLFFTDETLREKYHNHEKNGFVRITDDHSGGSKHLECELAIGAFNSLALAGLVEYLRTLKWKYPHSVQLIVCEDQKFKFRIIDVFPEAT